MTSNAIFASFMMIIVVPRTVIELKGPVDDDEQQFCSCLRLERTVKVLVLHPMFPFFGSWFGQICYVPKQRHSFWARRKGGCVLLWSEQYVHGKKHSDASAELN